MDSNKYLEYLQNQLEEERRNVRREKLAVARLQREVARSKSEETMREKLMHELEEERHLRLESEKRLQEVTLEFDRSKVQMRGLQEHFSRMEETVRNLLQTQGVLEPNGGDSANIMKAYQEKLSEEERKQKTKMEGHRLPVDEDSKSEISSTEGEKDKTKLLLERLKVLEAENSALALENENQREQYERCLDEVANQVVQALLTQKDLREECLKLKTRVVDLEQQNQILSVLFQHRMRPASDLLIQKLHSRLLDLSSGDLLPVVEKNRSLTHLLTADTQEFQQNVKYGLPALKCQAQLNMTGSSRLYPRSSCSSSELSLSSTCSEYSSGSSCTWNDGKTCSKKSSTNWDKRISIASSAHSNLSSPIDELPPTRIKENHILEGLKKLQERKGLLEPPTLKSKWGYKDCMDSNEGIYSPGIKYSSHNEHSHCKPKEMSGFCPEHRKTFIYDSDSHDDADDESSVLAVLHEVQSKDCRMYCKKLTHSISDSLFEWEPNGKHSLKKVSYFNSKEKPEKLTRFVDGFQSEVKMSATTKGPVLRTEKSPASRGCKDLNLQLSDTDDNDILDELHIGSSDEKRPSDLSLFTEDNNRKDAGRLIGIKKCKILFTNKEEKQVPTNSDTRSKTFNFIKQQKVIKKTSSEECVTVIFDAEDGEPIEFSSHQTGVVSLTRNGISLNQQQTRPSIECADLLPRGVNNIQKLADLKNDVVVEMDKDEHDELTSQDSIKYKNSIISTESSNSTRPVLQSSQKLIKSPCSISCKTSSISCSSAGKSQRHNLTKIPSKGTFLSPKSQTNSDITSITSSTSQPVLETSPSSPPVKLSRFLKTPGPLCSLDLKPNLNIPKYSVQLPTNSKIPARNEWLNNSGSQVPGFSLSPCSAIEPSDYGESPTKDTYYDGGSKSIHPTSPPTPPGRSASLLIRPNYEPSPSLSISPGSTFSSELTKNASKLSPLKSFANPAAFHNQPNNEKQVRKEYDVPAVDLTHSNADIIAQNKFIPHQSQSSLDICQGSSKVVPKKFSAKSCRLSLHCKNQDMAELESRRTKKISALGFLPLESSEKSAFSNKKGQSNNNGMLQQRRSPGNLPTSPQYHISSSNEPLISQVNSSQSPSTSCTSETANSFQNPQEKVLKTRLPVGLKVLVKSPQLLRKSSTIPGKQEKDSINAASKENVTFIKPKQDESMFQTTDITKDDNEIKNSVTIEAKVEPSSPHSIESSYITADRGDEMEGKLGKRCVSSSNKTYQKPALGMNGAKARGQSFSIHAGEKSTSSVSEGPGKVRTQIITNTADRGNSLTRQNLSTTIESPSTSSKVIEHSFSRQGSHGSMSSSGSQHGSPSKLPCGTPPKVDFFRSISKCEVKEWQKDACDTSVNNKQSTEKSKQQLHNEPRVIQSDMNLESSPKCLSPQRFQNVEKLRSPSKLEAKMSQRQDNIKSSEMAGDLNATLLHSTIEEKVMLGIQENVQKGQGQTKSPSPETKQRTGPSIANWFGFRKSKLPALNSKKTEISKPKMEKPETKSSSGFGNKQAKVDKKKDKKKNEHCEVENELSETMESDDTLDSVVKDKENARTSQVMPNQMQLEQKNGSANANFSEKDTFMKELLNRVDKKAAQQTESGSNNVSCRSVSKGSSQGSSLPSSNICTQGNRKKNSKLKADMEMQNETLVKAIAENVQDDGGDATRESACQSRTIESNCQMRTLDSGIGTFPLPDSGNRATGRHLSKQDPALETKIFTSPEPALLLSPSVKTKIFKEEVPSTEKSQNSEVSSICLSTADPVKSTKGLQPVQSCLPKSASSGIIKPKRQNEPEHSFTSSESLDHAAEVSESTKDLPNWGNKKATQTQDTALRACTYSASSDSDTETEYETSSFGTGEEKLLHMMKRNKPADREENGVRKSFTGNPVSIMDIYEHKHNLYVHYNEVGPEEAKRYTFLEQMCGSSNKEGSSRELTTKMKQVGETKEDSESSFAEISLESLNQFNRNSVILLEKGKNGLSMAEEEKGENGRTEESPSNCSNRPGVDNLESFSDSLYDSFSSCASQVSNDV
ncbi:nck-associated protein 5 [Microcaecilia unicolor]|uniref:Nck-associated protein 5 n=1 Tax=Microcaecilia unicolor TaxID=1415580 RepID=A0A6P7YRG4_9AMPH|nr:nck-associated protein 5 [Microcaecilia unicolor]